jgi:hypothetical protein
MACRDHWRVERYWPGARPGSPLARFDLIVAAAEEELTAAASSRKLHGSGWRPGALGRASAFDRLAGSNRLRATSQQSIDVITEPTDLLRTA